MTSEISNHLTGQIDAQIVDRISYLEAQLCKYKAELLQAQNRIQRLQAALLTGEFNARLPHLPNKG